MDIEADFEQLERAFMYNIKSYPGDILRWNELKRLARLGAAVEAMPPNSSLHYRPLNSNEIAPRGCMQWVLEQPGEATTDAQDPHTALTFGSMPCTWPDLG